MKTRNDLLRVLRAAGIECTEIRAGNGWMVIAPPLGARILGAGIGEENALWVAPRVSRGAWEAGGNAGGQRTWIAPEAGPRGFFFSADGSPWGVPAEIDPGNYAPAAAEEGWLSWRSAFTARAADGARFPIAITRSMRIARRPEEPDDGPVLCIRFRHTLENTGSAPIDRRIGLWCVVQVPSELAGTILIPTRVETPAAAVRPYFGALPPGVLRAAGGVAYLKALGGRKYKVGVSSAESDGRIAFLGRSRTGTGRILVALRFPVDPSAAYLDKPSHGPEAEELNGDPVQAYNDPGRNENAFSEIEAHAPALVLAPGACQSFEIDMTIASADESAISKIIRREVAAGVTDSELFRD